MTPQVRACLFTALARALALRSAAPARLPAHPRHVLFVRPDHLGDVLLTTPAFALARQAWPGARLTALVGPWGRPALEGNPDLDAVLTCRFPGFDRSRRDGGAAIVARLLLTGWMVRRLGVDLGITLRRDFWWGAALLALGGVPQRYGYAAPDVCPFLTRSLRLTEHHEARLALDLVRAAAPAAPPHDPPLRFCPTTSDRAWAQRVVGEASWEMGGRQALAPCGQAARSLSEGQPPLVVINPGAGMPVKQWSVGQWVEVGRRLRAAYGAQLALTGSATERPLCDALAAALGAPPPLVLAGETTWGQLAALLERCQLALGPDCGTLHLAVAMGVPSLALFGPAEPGRYGPWGNPRRHLALRSPWPCVPCHRLDYPPDELPDHACVPAITVERVWRAAQALLGPPVTSDRCRITSDEHSVDGHPSVPVTTRHPLPIARHPSVGVSA